MMFMSGEYGGTGMKNLSRSLSDRDRIVSLLLAKTALSQ